MQRYVWYLRQSKRFGVFTVEAGDVSVVGRFGDAFGLARPVTHATAAFVRFAVSAFVLASVRTPVDSAGVHSGVYTMSVHVGSGSALNQALVLRL